MMESGARDQGVGAVASTRLEESNSWRVFAIKSAEKFFGAIPRLLPDVTHMFLEGSPAPDVLAILRDCAADAEYRASRGTLWSWPQPDRRFSVHASAALFARLTDVAAIHAEPEICSHVHFYRDDVPLVQWFDAFMDPVLISKAVSRESVERFCVEVNGVLPPGQPLIFGVREDAQVSVFNGIDEVMRAWGRYTTDVISHVIVFYDTDGVWLEPIVTNGSRRWLGLREPIKTFALRRNAALGSGVDPIGVALSEASTLKGNRYFDSLESLRAHFSAGRV